MRNRFLYFLPTPGCSEKMLLNLGLHDRFTISGRLGPWCVTPVDAGPAGAGCIVAASQRPAEYRPECQAWEEGNGYWVGLENRQAPPGPEDLVRRSGIEGHPISLGDGELWHIPLVWKWNALTLAHDVNLPTAYRPAFKDGQSRMTPQVLSAYRPLVNIAERVWISFCERKPIPREQTLADAVELLAVNYRVGPIEVGLLGLINPQNIQDILGASVDYPLIKRMAEEDISRGVAMREVPEDVDEIAVEGGDDHG